MNLREVEAIADAVLYEGYLLYPYRASALKNRERWLLGVLYPRAYSEPRGGLEPWSLESECLLEGGPATEVEAVLRFLHPTARTVRRAAECGDRPLSDGEEASPVRVDVQPVRLEALAREGLHLPFAVGPDQDRELVCDGAGSALAAVDRHRHCLEGILELRASPVAEGVFKLTLDVQNLTPLAADGEGARAAARARGLASAHVILGVRGGRFLSLQDPPAALRQQAAGCRQHGAWPVLVGAPGRNDILLCSPIILDDYPAVAPESPGDLFDGTEIDEILTLRILTLTEDEKRQMAATDERARALLARTESLGRDDLARLHGALRHRPRPERLVVRGAALGPGDRVRLRPARGRDILDLALAGRTATIVSIEQDYENRVYFTVTVDDDPGADLGAEGKPGHRFFFEPEEVERLGERLD